MLSPIKGKNISQVETGDRIKINLSPTSPKAITVAKAFKVYDDGKISPIAGRVVSIRHLNDGGYKVYAIIAKGIYIKIEEEEEDIRIAMDSPQDAESLASSNPSIIIALVIVFIALIAVVLVIIVK